MGLGGMRLDRIGLAGAGIRRKGAGQDAAVGAGAGQDGAGRDRTARAGVGRDCLGTLIPGCDFFFFFLFACVWSESGTEGAM